MWVIGSTPSPSLFRSNLLYTYVSVTRRWNLALAQRLRISWHIIRCSSPESSPASASCSENWRVQPKALQLLSAPSSSEGKRRNGLFHSWINEWATGNIVWSLDNACYEVVSRRWTAYKAPVTFTSMDQISAGDCRRGRMPGYPISRCSLQQVLGGAQATWLYGRSAEFDCNLTKGQWLEIVCF